MSIMCISSWRSDKTDLKVVRDGDLFTICCDRAITLSEDGDVLLELGIEAMEDLRKMLELAYSHCPLPPIRHRT
jgi:hypothetical protein